MKKGIVYFLLVLLIFFASDSHAAVGDWELMGDDVNSDSLARAAKILSSPTSEDIFMMFDDGKVEVKKFNENSWETIGSDLSVSHTSTASNMSSSDLVYDQQNDILYITYSDHGISDKAVVKKYENGSWSSVGVEGLSEGEANYNSLALDSNNIPYIAYRDEANSQTLTVKKYDGSDWVDVGAGSISDGAVSSVSMEMDLNSDYLYVAYKDESNSNGITVKKFNGSVWSTVGNENFSSDLIYYTDLAINNETHEPYVVFSDNSVGRKITVMRFDGSNWQLVGSAGFSDQLSNSPRIVFDELSNEPYVAYADNDIKLDIQKFDGDSWVDIGSITNTGILIYLDISFNLRTNEPIIVYTPQMSSYKAVTRKYSLPSLNPPTSSHDDSSSYLDNEELEIELTSEYSESGIYYTLDGTYPTIYSNLYSSPINISSETVLKAVVAKENYAISEVMTKNFQFLNSSPVYRFYSPTGKSHFFTTSSSEKNRIIANYSNDWRYEGIAYYSYASSNSGLSPIYRFYSPTGKSHFFTISTSEKNNVIANYSNDWNYEGIAYYAYPSSSTGLTPVYRFYSPTGKSHFFTISESEKNNVITNYSNDWNYEGIAWYVPEN